MHTMVLCTKLWGLGMALYDGSVKDDKLRPILRDTRVKDVPGFLPFMSFCFCNFGCISGPFIEFRHFQEFMELKGFYANMPVGPEDGWATFKPSLMRLGGMYISAVLYVGAEIAGLDPDFIGSAEFLTYKTLLHRIGIMAINAVYFRLFFYVNWCMVDASLISSGISYNGKDESGEVQWDRLIGVRIMKCEFAYSGVDYMHNWNISVNSWLLRYVHIRWVEDHNVKQGFDHAMATAVVSSVWHGFYVSYPSAFIQAAIVTECSREIYRSRAAFDWMNPTIRAFSAWLLTMLAFSYIGCAFRILLLENHMNFNAATGYVFTLGVPVLCALLKFLQLGRKKKTDVKKVEQDKKKSD